MDSLGNLPLFLYGTAERILEFRYNKKIRTPKNKFDLKEVANIIITRNDYKEHLYAHLVGQIFVLNEKGKNKGEILNKWIKKYANDFKYVFIWDSDSDVYNSDYVNAINYFSEKDAWVQTEIKANKGIFSSDVNTFFNNKPRENFISCGHNVCYKTRILKENLFPEQMGEDFILSSTLFSKGYTSYLAPIITIEENPNTFQSFIKREFKWAGLEKNYIVRLPKIFKSKVLNLRTKILYLMLFLRSIISLIIFTLALLTLILFIKISLLFFLIFIFFAVIPSTSLEMIFLSFPLNITTAIGFIFGLFKNHDYFITTHDINSNYHKESAILFISLLIIVVLALRNFIFIQSLSNKIFDIFLLVAIIAFAFKYMHSKY